MSRRRRAEKRSVLPDPKFTDLIVSKFINAIMLDGKKAVAESICYKAFDMLVSKTGQDSVAVFKKALNNVKPDLEVKSRRVGGSTYQVPVEVRPDRQNALAMRWIIGNARSRNEKTMFQRLAGELLDAYDNKGGSIKKRDDVQKMAEANKAFAHYRW